MKSTIVLAAAVIAVAGTAIAQAPDGLAAIKERREHMKAMGGSAQTITRFLKGEAGTVDDVKKAASTIQQHAEANLPALFVPGTAVGVGESKAREDVWKQNAQFRQTYQQLPPAARALNQAAQTGDKAQITTAFQAAGRVCQTCHESFRAPLR